MHVRIREHPIEKGRHWISQQNPVFCGCGQHDGCRTEHHDRHWSDDPFAAAKQLISHETGGVKKRDETRVLDGNCESRKQTDGHGERDFALLVPDFE